MEVEFQQSFLKQFDNIDHIQIRNGYGVLTRPFQPVFCSVLAVKLSKSPEI